MSINIYLRRRPLWTEEDLNPTEEETEQEKERRYRVLRGMTIERAELEYASLNQALEGYSREPQKLNTDTRKEIELLNRITALVDDFWLIYRTREDGNNTFNVYEEHIYSFLSPGISLKDMVKCKQAYKEASKGYLLAVITRNKKRIAARREAKKLLQEEIAIHNKSATKTDIIHKQQNV